MIKYIIIILCLLINLSWSSEINAFVDSSENLILKEGEKQIGFFNDRYWILKKGMVYGLNIKNNVLIIELYNLKNKMHKTWNCRLQILDGIELMDADFKYNTLLVQTYNIKTNIYIAYRITILGIEVNCEKIYRDKNYFWGFIINQDVFIEEFFQHLLLIKPNTSKIDTIFDTYFVLYDSDIKKIDNKILVITDKGRGSFVINPEALDHRDYVSLDFSLELFELSHLYCNGNFFYILHPIYSGGDRFVKITQLFKINILENTCDEVLKVPGEVIFYSFDKNNFLHIYTEEFKIKDKKEIEKIRSLHYIFKVDEKYKLIKKEPVNSLTLFKLY